MLLLRSDSLDETFFHREGIVVGIDGPALFIDQDMLGWYRVEGKYQEDTGKEGLDPSPVIPRLITSNHADSILILLVSCD